MNDTRHHMLWTVTTGLIVDKSTDQAKPHFDLFFFYHDIKDGENKKLLQTRSTCRNNKKKSFGKE